MLATEAGLGYGETPIFPVQIFRVKEGVNYNPGEPNYDLFKLAMRCSAKRLFPNFSFMDAPFNLQYYKPGRRRPRSPTWAAAPGSWATCTTPSREICNGRGNLSLHAPSTCPGWPSSAKGDLDLFFDGLDRMLELCVEQLLERFEIQCRKHVYNARSSWARACGSTPTSWLPTTRAGGAQARHADRGLHRPGRDPRGPDRPASRRVREGRSSWAWRSSATCGLRWTACRQSAA